MQALIRKLLHPIVVAMWLLPASAPAVDSAESMSLLVQTIEQTDDPAVQASLMRGILAGLTGRRNLTIPVRWNDLSAKLADSPDPEVRELSQQLSQLFGDEAATRKALQTLANPLVSTAARRSALRSLLLLQNEQVSSQLQNLLDEPELRLDAIRGYADVENPRAPQILLSRYARWDPPLQRAVVETLATRKPYAEKLITAVSDRRVGRQDIPPHVARSLRLLLGDKATSILGDVPELSQDRQTQLAKYKKLITPEALEAADVSAGRAVFKKTCASCHLLYGDGAQIGPDLTGSNRANLDYILLNSVDPSYDVPEGYKMVLIQTDSGRLISGVIAEEDDQRVILKTVEQPRLIIAKDEIIARKVSPKSMMPDGQLDQLKPQEVINLIKYLRTTEQVELPK